MGHTDLERNALRQRVQSARNAVNAFLSNVSKDSVPTEKLRRLTHAVLTKSFPSLVDSVCRKLWTRMWDWSLFPIIRISSNTVSNDFPRVQVPVFSNMILSHHSITDGSLY